jgi:hypothetical protein
MCTGLALVYGMSAGVTESALAVITLVLLGMGAGAVISYLVQALSRRPQATGEGDTRPPDSPLGPQDE